MTGLRFPEGFRWGVSTSAYQIEGSPAADGRLPSIWDAFSGGAGDTACDHYRRWESDLDLLVELGVDTYRFSLAWPRILPDGRTPNPAGLAHYSRLVDGLLERSITPLVTLYHWDLPQALQDRGGWVERDSAGWFADYAERCVAALGDRVRDWVTINEPWIVGVLGYQLGIHAPGEKDVGRSLRAMHHLMLGHGLATQAIAAAGGRAGCAFSLFPNYPADPASPADVAAAWASDGYVNRWFLDPVLRGRYPDDTAAVYEELAGPLTFDHPGDLATIATPSAFIGVNYYTRRLVRADPARADRFPWSVAPPAEGVPVTDAGWEIVPDCLTDLLVRLHRDYGDIPIVITENGAVYDAAPDDPGRVEYLRAHLAACHRAIEAGVPLAGYCHWSLMDNLEWALGYSHRFGLVHVDYGTQRRTLKSSARYYASVIRRREV
jgi:beta-glucosidase